MLTMYPLYIYIYCRAIHVSPIIPTRTGTIFEMVETVSISHRYLPFVNLYCSMTIWASLSMRSHIGWGGERSILYKGIKTSP